jgi:hypothetical protein
MRNGQLVPEAKDLMARNRTPIGRPSISSRHNSISALDRSSRRQYSISLLKCVLLLTFAVRKNPAVI